MTFLLFIVFIVQVAVLLNNFDYVYSSVNLAKGKNTQQSPGWDSAPSSKAVDGDRRQNFYKGSCTHTNGGIHITSAWWWVDLGFESEIKQIKIYYRSDTDYRKRLNGYVIHIYSNTNSIKFECYKDPDPMTLPPSLTPIHYCPHLGRYVNMSVERIPGQTYSQYDNNGAIINLCEFEVYGCQKGYYGNNVCDKNCSDGCQNLRCDPDYGNCSCKAGWTGDECTEKICPDGFYGTSCNIKCPEGCNEDACDPSTGKCIKGCNNNLFGTYCNLTCPKNCASNVCNQDTGQCSGECDTGLFGVYCNLTCSSGCNNIKCNKDQGDCSLGCKDEFTGNKCQDCVSGRYGKNCAFQCSINCNQTICNRNNGSCLQGCTKQGMTGDKCEECKSRFHGVNCTDSCSQFCKDYTCDKQNGTCLNGCTGNYSGPTCNECQNGYFGDFCNQSCSENCADNKCWRNNGSCVDCKKGWKRPDCSLSSRSVDSNVPDQSGNLSTTVIAVVVAVVIVIVIVITVVIVAIRKRKQKGEQGKNKNKTYFSNLRGSLRNVRDYENPPDAGQEGQNPTCMRDVYENTPVYGNLHSTEVPVTELSTLISKKTKEKEFEKEYAKLTSGAVHPCTVGQDPDNKIKNRFLTTFPYDHSRVVLEPLTGQAKSDYINANYIDGVEERFLYVAAQGPKLNTISDFWRMIWQIEAGKIVMLTNLKEGKKVKCDKYWPDASQTMDVGILKVTSNVEKEFAFYIKRSLSLYNKKTKKTRKIKQFHFTMWPDHGTPDPVQLMLFHRKIKNAESLLNGPCVVHYSAGIGRTGTFIALDALHEYGDRTGKIDIFEYVIRMRKDRMNMIQTVDQYIVLHEALLESFQYAGRSMTRDQFLQICNEMQNGKPKNQTHIYKEYQSLSSLRPVYGVESYESALEKENKRKSRNLNILAVEKYRPYLISFHSSRTNFINAVILPSCSQRCGYLVTHYPLKDTMVDLWCMIFDHDSVTVAVLDENGDKDEKSVWYPRGDEEMDMGFFSITKVSGPHIYSSIQEMDFTVKHKGKDEERNVKIFLLRPWPTGNCIPPDKTDLLKQLELVDNNQRATNGPVTVICSDGAQCCGLFCTVRNAIQNLRLDEEIDVFHTVRQFHIRRPQFFATFEEYQSCYDMVKTYLESSNVYANSSVM